MSEVILEGISKRYGALTALEELDLTAREGELLTLLGPSGCGKTTTLRLIAGFVQPTSGRIKIGERDVTRDPPNRRGLGMVFQSYALFPHLTIAENVGFAMREQGASTHSIRVRVGELLDLIRLPETGDRFPAELSGGQQQRVALARALAREPRVLLMDEPLGALDLKLRDAMQMEIRRIQQEIRITTVYVTHDQSEAMRISDKIAVMNHGRIVQFGTAEEIYNRPSNRFVSNFVGKINLVAATFLENAGAFATFSAAGQSFRVPHVDRPRITGSVTVGIRPEDLRLVRLGSDVTGLNLFRGTLERRLFLGNVCEIYVRISSELLLMVEAHPKSVPELTDGHVSLAWNPANGKILLH